MCDTDDDCTIDHEYTDEIICPYCGSEFSDSDDIEPNDEILGLQYCEECEKGFYAFRSVTVDYSTEKATYGTCKHCGEKNVVVEDYHSSLGAYEGLCVPCGGKEKRRFRDEYMKRLETRVGQIRKDGERNA
ncbi:hypothetical protein [Desulfitobacterium chlororespirans]|uniref:Uncharacterized protein n=1 Tax=Desulfitobacterium chlororespirans DSM 11544 TaxID=1121395 RepID=A0A1M7U3S2_9FIRM|nr:hypothetical protein [Desulfitobacterium chlororespirans]SHN77543.1 hypothetical protein SAMN02745215_02901 [Desulfitobacterium chlororespirans DSM 11544]